MSMENLKTDAAIQDETDSLGGYILDSNIYPMVVDMAYLDKSKGGAMSLNLTFKGSNGENLRQTLWMTSGEAKGCNNYYTDKNGKRHYLPGFNMANSIAQLSIGKEIGDIATEEKTIKVYDFTERKEVPQPKQVFTDLIGAEITLGVVRQVVDKNIKNDAGVYVPSGETREENEIDKAFRTKDGMTTAEVRAESTDAEFLTKWQEKNKGITKNKAKGASTSGAASGTPAGGETKSLFN